MRRLGIAFVLSTLSLAKHLLAQHHEKAFTSAVRVRAATLLSGEAPNLARP